MDSEESLGDDSENSKDVPCSVTEGVISSAVEVCDFCVDTEHHSVWVEKRIGLDVSYKVVDSVHAVGGRDFAGFDLDAFVLAASDLLVVDFPCDRHRHRRHRGSLDQRSRQDPCVHAHLHTEDVSSRSDLGSKQIRREVSGDGRMVIADSVAKTVT